VRLSALLMMLLLASSAAPRAALGERSSDRRARAEALLREGNGLYDRGEFRAALERYRAARDLYPSFKIDFNIGIALEALGHSIEAAEQLERFLRRAALADEAIVGSARRRLEALRRRLASVDISCNVDGATIRVDGAPVGRTPLEGRVYLRPGEHRVEARAAGHAPYRRTLDLAAGDHRGLTATLRRVELRATPPLPLPPAPAARPIYKRWWLWTLVGTAIAGGAVAAIVASTRPGTRVPTGELGTIP
jgi:tetratricopeptide (TPR) repeat protein